MATAPKSPRENRLLASISTKLLALEKVEKKRTEMLLGIQEGVRALAKERGCTFLRLESVRQELGI